MEKIITLAVALIITVAIGYPLNSEPEPFSFRKTTKVHLSEVSDVEMSAYSSPLYSACIQACTPVLKSSPPTSQLALGTCILT